MTNDDLIIIDIVNRPEIKDKDGKYVGKMHRYYVWAIKDKELDHVEDSSDDLLLLKRYYPGVQVIRFPIL